MRELRFPVYAFTVIYANKSYIARWLLDGSISDRDSYVTRAPWYVSEDEPRYVRGSSDQRDANTHYADI